MENNYYLLNKAKIRSRENSKEYKQYRCERIYYKKLVQQLVNQLKVNSYSPEVDNLIYFIQNQRIKLKRLRNDYKKALFPHKLTEVDKKSTENNENYCKIEEKMLNIAEKPINIVPILSFLKDDFAPQGEG